MEIISILLGSLGTYLVLSLFGLLPIQFLLKDRLPRRFWLISAPAFGILSVGLVTASMIFFNQAQHLQLVAWAITILSCLCIRQFIKLLQESELLIKLSFLSVVVLILTCLIHQKIFQSLAPGVDPVWTVYNQTGTSPPDQMFAWHQALFFKQSRKYGVDEFYGDIDLLDRPLLGGCITLYMSELFGYSLVSSGPKLLQHHTENYPLETFPFYHSLWWTLNGLYGLIIGVIVCEFAGRRAALTSLILLVLSSHCILSISGIWVKMVTLYPLALSILFFANCLPVLSALMFALAFHLHGSVLPFILSICAYVFWLFIKKSKINFFKFTAFKKTRNELLFALLIVLTIVPWFVVPKLLGSTSPLQAYYLYDAGLTEARTVPLEKIKDRFYRSINAEQLAVAPAFAIAKNIFPLEILEYIRNFSYKVPESFSLKSVATAFEQTQLNSISGILGNWAIIFVFAGVLLLLNSNKGTIFLIFGYLLPTLFMAFLYRKQNSLVNHIIPPYHMLAVLFASLSFSKLSNRTIWLTAFFGLAEMLLSLFCGEMRFSSINKASITLTDLYTKESGALSVLCFAYLLFFILLHLSLINVFKDKNILEVDNKLLNANDDTFSLEIILKRLSCGLIFIISATLIYYIGLRVFVY